MIKVLVIEPTIFGYDGITNVVTNYYLYQNHKELQMDLVTINPVSKKLKDELKKNGNSNYVIQYRNKKPLRYVYTLKSIIKKNGYQIVHVHGCSSTIFVEMLAAKLAGVKIRIAHSHNTTCEHVRIDKILRPFFLTLCTDGFACGKEAGEWLFNGRNFDVIPNGIDLQKFEYNESIRLAFRKKYKLENKLVIGHVGRFSQQKNHKKLIEIFEAISKKQRDAKLVLIGDGELKSEIEKVTQQKELDVLFVGLSDEVEKWLQAMDIMVFPSLFEGLPLGIVEAQASGLPCVLSDTVSPMTAITDLVQFIKLDADADVWAEKVIETDTTQRSAYQLEVETQIKAAHFDIRENCDKMEKVYKKKLAKLNTF